ncbi:unnamed protein product [Adineta steineri]|uniref:Uncharacterized protein n=1 Tax=Adineta steineri TaxID=433720 RepID=A0A814GYJ5_9BILA|nr:unnamed protein product [Adineta steineri]CAF1272233.1 unnamed protein product [Adineta steineri]
MLLTPKSIFQHRCEFNVIPNIDRIVSLRLSNVFTINFFLSKFTIDASFACLESLILDGIHTAQLIPILSCLASAPRLFRLTFRIIDIFKQHNDVYRLIFRLPALRYAKIEFKHDVQSRTLLTVANKHELSSPIEHLVIAGMCYLDELNALVSYTPRLCRLSCRSLYGFKDTGTVLLKLPTTLTHISVENCVLSFDEFELFISKVNSQKLEVLRIYRAAQDVTYLNAQRWQRILSNYIPNLHKFDFFHRNVIDENDLEYAAYHTLINQFTSSYWIKRKWHFVHRHYYFWNAHSADFCSSQSYWKNNNYDLFEHQDNETCPIQYTGNNLACSVSILGSQKTIADCSLQFPCATTLALTIPFICDDDQWTESFINDLNRCMYLTKLTKLSIDYVNLTLPMLFELLLNVPNIHSLYLSHMPHSQATDIEHTCLLPKNNKITKITIYHGYTLECINAFISLFHQLEILDIRIGVYDLNSIKHFLSLKKSEKNCRLFSLRISGVQSAMVEDLQTMINQEKLFDDYSFESDFVHSSAVCLWW